MPDDYTSPQGAEGVFTVTMLDCGCLIMLCMKGTLVLLECPKHSGLRTNLQRLEQCLPAS